MEQKRTSKAFEQAACFAHAAPIYIALAGRAAGDLIEQAASVTAGAVGHFLESALQKVWYATASKEDRAAYRAEQKQRAESEAALDDENQRFLNDRKTAVEKYLINHPAAPSIEPLVEAGVARERVPEFLAGLVRDMERSVHSMAYNAMGEPVTISEGGRASVPVDWSPQGKDVGSLRDAVCQYLLFHAPEQAEAAWNWFQPLIFSGETPHIFAYARLTRAEGGLALTVDDGFKPDGRDEERAQYEGWRTDREAAVAARAVRPAVKWDGGFSPR